MSNEPNLDLNDPKDCVRYQKAVCAAMKAADPACRLVGVCTTQDFGVDNADSFARGCLEKGIARIWTPSRCIRMRQRWTTDVCPPRRSFACLPTS